MKQFFLCIMLFASNQLFAQEAVDLGLSVKWANMDLGATNPYEKGKRYAWGETDTKREPLYYSDETQVANRTINGDIDISGTSRDAAREAWGGKWRMPNRLEVNELFNKCKRETTYINKKKFFKFTGPNGNSILIPTQYYANYGNDYWSASSAYKEHDEAMSFGMAVYESTYRDFSVGTEDLSRSKKMAIRPVMSFGANETSWTKQKKQEEISKEIDRIIKSGSIFERRKLADYYYKARQYDMALKVYGVLANGGDMGAGRIVAKMYELGQGITKDVKRAINMYVDLAIKGDTIAQEYLLDNYFKMLYQSDELLSILSANYKENSIAPNQTWQAICCSAAAIKGNIVAMKEMGKRCSEGKGLVRNQQTAALWYDRAAKKGDITAMMELGMRYKEGKGVMKNSQKAVNWFEEAANKGNVEAMFIIGRIYLDQTLEIHDTEKAIYWYTKAADNNYRPAMEELGKFYRDGIHVKKNKKMAKKYLGEF